MSRYFVTDLPVAVPEFDPSEAISDVPPNIIYIRAKMDVATKAKVTSELFTLSKDNNTVEARLGANELALLIHNIVRWEGPDLGSVPCTEAVIRTMDPTEPHLAKVLEAIAVRNKGPKVPKGSPTASTSESDGDHVSNQSNQSISAQLATGTSRSALRSAMDGRLIRSVDSTPTILTNSSDD